MGANTHKNVQVQITAIFQCALGVMTHPQIITQPVIYLVDDDAAIRKSVTLALEQAGMTVAAFDNAETFLASDFAGRPGCAIVDMCMPGINGIQVQEILANQAIPMPVIILTGFGDISMCVEAMKSGVNDFLLKPITYEKLLASVRSALSRAEQMLAQAEQSQHYQQRIMELTKREQEIMMLLVSCLSNKEIGRRLNISYRTVEKHRMRILYKTGSDSLLDLLGLAQKCGLLSG